MSQALKLFSDFKKELSLSPNNGLKTSCTICLGCLSLCSKCEIKKLKQQLADAKEVIDFLTGYDNRLLKLSISQRNIVDSTFQRNSDPVLIFPKDFDEKDFIFITLTMDPEKFGSNNCPEAQKYYYLYILAQLVNSKHKYLDNVYGSFEYHKNGSVHVHLISQFCDVYKINEHLKKALTNRPRNKCAVVIKSVRGIQKLLQYIGKESDSYFTTNMSLYYPGQLTNGLDD